MKLDELVMVILNGARGAIERGQGLKAGLEPETLTVQNVSPNKTVMLGLKGNLWVEDAGR